MSCCPWHSRATASGAAAKTWHLKIGIASFFLGFTAQAVEHLRHVDTALAYYYLGRSLASRQDYDDALKAYDEAVVLLEPLLRAPSPAKAAELRTKLGEQIVAESNADFDAPLAVEEARSPSRRPDREKRRETREPQRPDKSTKRPPGRDRHRAGRRDRSGGPRPSRPR